MFATLILKDIKYIGSVKVGTDTVPYRMLHGQKSVGLKAGISNLMNVDLWIEVYQTTRFGYEIRPACD